MQVQKRIFLRLMVQPYTTHVYLSVCLANYQPTPTICIHVNIYLNDHPTFETEKNKKALWTRRLYCHLVDLLGFPTFGLMTIETSFCNVYRGAQLPDSSIQFRPKRLHSQKSSYLPYTSGSRNQAEAQQQLGSLCLMIHRIIVATK